jgi:hypothetical protein
LVAGVLVGAGFMGVGFAGMDGRASFASFGGFIFGAGVAALSLAFAGLTAESFAALCAASGFRFGLDVVRGTTGSGELLTPV